MRNVVAASLALAASLISSSVALAQDPVEQTVIVTAAAAPVTMASATRTVTVVTREEIAALPARSVADVLRLVSSVDVRARGVRGVQTDFSIRGAGFGQMLVLVDGVRLNDLQSGHHSGDIPVPLDAIERIEVLHGPGSSLFGADAFGGTINIITRHNVMRSSAAIEGGSFGFAGASGQTAASLGPLRQTLAGSAERSDGFTFARDFERAVLRSSTAFGDRARLSASYLHNDFGANGFYGASPSHEWTSQTLVAGDGRLGGLAGWRVDGSTAYRTHGDRFLWDVRRPGVSENQHRSHAVLGTVKASRRIGGASFVVGGEGGADWIRSNNLGDHVIRRASGFGEWRQALGARTHAEASLRVDRYTEFGTAWSPGFGVGHWAASWLKLRASSGRVFRVPTFTERYYSDPAHLARPDLGPETAWSGDAGADVFASNGWHASATVFARWERNVIDWLRPSVADRWRTVNVRAVDTVGVELSARKTLAGGAFVQAGYTGLRMEAAAVTELSKYVQDSTPHALTMAAAVPVGGGVSLAPRFEYKRRGAGASARDAVLLDVRVSRRLGLIDVLIDATNLFDDTYQEIVGVDMPGRAVTASLVFGLR